MPEWPAEARSRQEYYDSVASSKSGDASAIRPWVTAKPAIERLEWQVPLDEGANMRR